MHQMDPEKAKANCLEILTRHAEKLGLSIRTEEIDEWGRKYMRFDVIGDRPESSDEGWFCFSIILTMPELRTGAWMRWQMECSPLLGVTTTDSFEPTDFDRWLGSWFENAALEELTKPRS